MFLSMILNYLFHGLRLILHVSAPGEFPQPLSPARERQLIEKWCDERDEDAKNELIEHNLRLVAHVVKKYNIPQNEQEDMISIGTIGLVKAVISYTPDKATRLSTYAARCIENEVLMQFRSRKKSERDVYMSDPIDVDKEGNALTLADIIAADDDMVDIVDLKMKTTKLYEYIDKALDKREKRIIFMRYGLGGKRALTQRETAAKLGISRSYVSRIEKTALDKLAVCFKQR